MSTSRPILFSAPMIRALLEGRKTQTRRVVKPQPPEGTDALRDIPGENRWWAAYATHDANGVTYRPLGSDQQHSWRCPYGRPSDLIWVRETWDFRPWSAPENPNAVLIVYGADAEQRDATAPDGWNPVIYNYERWRPSIFMPRWASRITLRITDVRVERLQDISEADAIAEGLYVNRDGCYDWDAERVKECGWVSPIGAYRDLWESINGPGSWAANPWVWALSFIVEKRNVDAILKEAA